MSMPVSSLPVSSQSLPSKSKPVPFRVFVSGKVVGGRTFQAKEGRIFLHILKTKAVDEYSHPGTVEISSSQKLASTGDEWEGYADLVGYPHSFEVTDKATGDVTVIHTAKMSLRACAE